MANIKIDVDTLMKVLRDEAKLSKERLENIVKHCTEELNQAASAVQTIPPTAVDLIATSEACLVADVDTRQHSSSHDLRLQVTIDLDAGRTTQMATYEYRPRVPQGRYRAIFVLVPIEKR